MISPAKTRKKKKSWRSFCFSPRSATGLVCGCWLYGKQFRPLVASIFWGDFSTAAQHSGLKCRWLDRQKSKSLAPFSSHANQRGIEAAERAGKGRRAALLRRLGCKCEFSVVWFENPVTRSRKKGAYTHTPLNATR